MAQTTGKKVAVTPMPTPTGTSGAIIDSFNTQDDQTVNAPSIHIVKDVITTINDNLSGFKFYPTGTGIVGLIADDSAYTDADGNYIVWGTPTANQLVADNPNTYKSVPSTEDTRGEVGADTGIPFKGGADGLIAILYITGAYECVFIINDKYVTKTNSNAVNVSDDGISISVSAGAWQTMTVTITTDRPLKFKGYNNFNGTEVEFETQTNVPLTFSAGSVNNWNRICWYS